MTDTPDTIGEPEGDGGGETDEHFCEECMGDGKWFECKTCGKEWRERALVGDDSDRCPDCYVELS